VFAPTNLALSVGSCLTINFCKKHKKPFYHYYLDPTYPQLLGEVVEWFQTNKIKTLNVAGSRETSFPGTYALTKFVVKEAVLAYQFKIEYYDRKF